MVQRTVTILVAKSAGRLYFPSSARVVQAVAGDEFVEFQQHRRRAHVPGGYGLFKMGASCSATPLLIGTIPSGTVIPARGHYLFVGGRLQPSRLRWSLELAGRYSTLTATLEMAKLRALQDPSVAGLLVYISSRRGWLWQ